MLMLHGYGSSGLLFYKMIGDLQAHFNITLVDFLGMGSSGRPPFSSKVVSTPKLAIDYFIVSLLLLCPVDGDLVLLHRCDTRCSVYEFVIHPSLVGGYIFRNASLLGIGSLLCLDLQLVFIRQFLQSTATSLGNAASFLDTRSLSPFDTSPRLLSACLNGGK